MRKSKLIVFALVLVFALTSVAFADTLKSGSTGTEVKTLQQQLKKLGYYKEEITGYFGPVTEAAVKLFQKKNGISADGVVGSGTNKKLTGQVNKTVVVSATEKIKKIQQSLSKQGLYKGKADGIYGKGTIAAIKQFQSAKKLKVTGKLDSTTEKAILASSEIVVASRGNINRQEAVAQAKEDTKQAEGQTSTDDEVVNEDLQDDNGAESDNNSIPEDNNEVTTVEPGEYLDWWNFVRDYFKIGTDAQVIDFQTGKTFNIRRTYGTNHADSETLTKEDTAIMKELWGGKWNWTRRPVIVVINGRRIAASIAGMPHAGRDDAPAGAIVKNRSVGYGTGSNLDKIKGNNMDGHFDVHFLNSRTHGTNRIDSAHQKAVRIAAGKI